MIITIFENDFVICELDDSLPVLRHRWKHPPSGDEFKSNLLRILDEYKVLKRTYHPLAWLADTKLLDELDEDVQKWLEDVWENLLFENGEVKVHAVILGVSIFADYPMEKFKQDAEEKFRAFEVHLGVFSDQREAYHWIRQQLLKINERKAKI